MTFLNSVQVCDRLGIVEKDYFGLQYTNSRGETYWLNMRNRVTRQLVKPEPYSLTFCVKFYVQPHQLLQESTRSVVHSLYFAVIVFTWLFSDFLVLIFYCTDWPTKK